MAKCHYCGRKFSQKELDDASDGRKSPVGDWDWICYSCQFKLMDEGDWDEYRGRMLIKHNGSGKCNH